MSNHDVRPDDLAVFGLELAEERDKYKNAFQNIDVPDDMTDRIMAALGGELPAAESKTEGVPHRQSPSRSAQQRGRSQRRVRFMHSAAGIAACFVMSVGMLTMTDPAGLRIIGLGNSSDDISVSQIYGDDNAPERSDSSSENRQQETDTSGNVAASSSETEAPSTVTDGPGGSDTITGSASNGVAAAVNSGSTAASGTAQTGRTGAASGTRPAVTTGTNTTNRPASPSQTSGTGDTQGNDTPAAPVDENKGGESDPSNGSQPDQAPEPSEPSGQDDTSQYASNIQNPVRLAQSTASLSSVMSFEPDFITTLPDGWMEVSAESIWGDTAQVVYSNGSDRVVYRTARGNDDISEDNNQYAFVTERDGFTLKGMGKEKIYLVIWTENDRSYSISFHRAVDQETALSWAKSAFTD